MKYFIKHCIYLTFAICEPYAIAGSLDITPYGSWRGWLRSRAQPAA
jgi:hypothetical protein